MSKIFTIARREIEERWFVFAVAGALMFEPFLYLFSRNGTRDQRLGAVLIFGVVLAIAYTLGLALVLGASMIGRDAREKRLSFYFSRPVSGSAIWFGKLLGAVVVLVVSSAILFLPPAILAPSYWRHVKGLGLPLVALGGFGIALLFLLVSHAAATMLRSRSAWVAVDVVAAAIFLTGVAFAFSPFLLHYAVRLMTATAAVLLVLMGVALVAAGAWQLSRGRGDVARHHRELSFALWISLAALLVVLGLFSWWVVSAGPTDLQRTNLQQASSGPMAFVAGEAKNRGGYLSAFFVFADSTTGKYVEAPISGLFYDSAINDAGTAAASREMSAGERFQSLMPWSPPASLGKARLVVHRISGRSLERIDTAIRVPAESTFSDAVKLSDDAKMVAVTEGDLLSIHEVASGRSLGTVKIPLFERERVARSRLLNDGTALCVTTSTDASNRVRVFRFDPRTRSLRAVLDVVTPVAYYAGSLSEDGSRLLLNTSKRAMRYTLMQTYEAVRLFDLTRGTELASITMPPGARTSSSWLLRDGRIAVAVLEGNRASVRIFAENGTQIRSIDLGTAGRANIFGEVAPGTLLVTGVATRENTRGWQSWISRYVDVDRGVFLRSERGLIPGWHSHLGAGATIGAPASHLFMTGSEGTIVTWDPATGEKKKVF